VADKNPPFELKIQVDEKTAEGIYVNFLSVLHNQAEFVMDFGRIVPGKPEVKIMARLLTNPIALKQIVHTLAENLERYENAFDRFPRSRRHHAPRGRSEARVSGLRLSWAHDRDHPGQVVGMFRPPAPGMTFFQWRLHRLKELL
jgi:hypothetical protein